MSQKRGLAVFFGCVIAIAVSYVATYSRFNPPPAAVSPAATSAPAPTSSAVGLTADLAPLPLPLPAANGPLSWARLSAAQRAALAPFADQWDGFSDARKRKWLRIASRFAKLTPEAQKQLQERMAEWAHMTPEQRRVARENYQSAKETVRAGARTRVESLSAIARGTEGAARRDRTPAPAERRQRAADRRGPRRAPPRACARASGQQPGRRGTRFGRRGHAARRLGHLRRTAGRHAGVARRRPVTVQGFLNCRGERSRSHPRLERRRAVRAPAPRRDAV